MIRGSKLLLAALLVAGCTKSNDTAGRDAASPTPSDAGPDAGAGRDAAPDPTGDRDDDGVVDLFDNCPAAANHDQADTDDDGAGEVCDVCPGLADPEQADDDGDGVGDACDPDDDDGDGLPASDDNCPGVANPEQADADNDGRGDACDNCPDSPNFSQADADSDGIGDACEVTGDDDADGVPDAQDVCPDVADPPQGDRDNDGRGDACDNCPESPNFAQVDGDGDGVGDACEVPGPPDAGGRDAGPPEADAALVCPDGDRRCAEVGVAEVCRDGAWAAEPCAAGRMCQAGQCIDAGDPCVGGTDHHGCDFWAVQLPNTAHREGAQGTTPDAPMALVIHNPHPARPAVVDVLQPDGATARLVPEMEIPVPADLGAMAEPATVRSETLDARGQVVRSGYARAQGIEVPPGGQATLLFPVVPPPRTDASLVISTALRLRSDRPVAVWQHNPVCCFYSFSNDASLLYPARVLGRDYRFLGVPTYAQAGGFPGLDDVYLPGALVVVGTAADTRVAVTLPPGVVVAAPLAPVMVEAGVARVTLDAHEVLVLHTGGLPFGGAQPDLSGAHVAASAPVAVFSSHECATFPEGQVACDHLEEQLLPTTRWGHRYVLGGHAARFDPQPATDRTHWKIIARDRGTRVTLSVPIADLAAGRPGYAGVSACADRMENARSFILNTSEHCELPTRAAFALESTGPVQVLAIVAGHTAAGGGNAVGEQGGDPAMFLAIPVEQWSARYEMPLPDHYARQTATLVMESAARLQLEGAALAGARVAVLGGGYDLVRVELDAPLSALTADRPFGVFVYAFDQFVSVAYAAGAALGP